MPELPPQPQVLFLLKKQDKVTPHLGHLTYVGTRPYAVPAQPIDGLARIPLFQERLREGLDGVLGLRYFYHDGYIEADT